VDSIAVTIRRPVQMTAAIFVALGKDLRVGIRTVRNLIERRFAEFAGVPYQNAHSRQQWEELFRAEP
jgi:broad specificity phosphatase PhoE